MSQGTFQRTRDSGHWPEVSRTQKHVPKTPVSTFPNADFPPISGFPLLNASVEEVERNIQAPRPLIVNCAMAAISLSQQGLIDVRKPSGQVVPTTLMILSIADSGVRKSAVDNVYLDPIRQFQREQLSRYENNLKEWKLANDIWLTKRQAIIKTIRKKASENDSTVDEEEQLKKNEREKPIEPKQFRMLYEDATPEALYFGLYQNMPSAGLVSSEGVGVINGRAFNALSQQNALWSGDSVSIDRKTQPTFELVDKRLTVSIMVQGTPFRDYLQKRGKSARGSGLWARFLVAEPATTEGTRFIEHNTQSWEHRERFRNRIIGLLEINANEFERGNLPIKKTLTFSPEAAELWIKVFNTIEKEIRPGGRYEDAGDHASKLSDNIARISAHLHHFENFEGDISVQTLEIATKIGFWYSDQFLSIFNPETNRASDAEKLNNWLIYNQPPGRRYIRKNKVRQYGPYCIRDKQRLENALEHLEIQGFIKRFQVNNIEAIDYRPAYSDDPWRIPYELDIKKYSL